MKKNMGFILLTRLAIVQVQLREKFFQMEKATKLKRSNVIDLSRERLIKQIILLKDAHLQMFKTQNKLYRILLKDPDMKNPFELLPEEEIIRTKALMELVTESNEFTNPLKILSYKFKRPELIEDKLREMHRMAKALASLSRLVIEAFCDISHCKICTEKLTFNRFGYSVCKECEKLNLRPDD